MSWLDNVSSFFSGDKEEKISVESLEGRVEMLESVITQMGLALQMMVSQHHTMTQDFMTFRSILEGTKQMPSRSAARVDLLKHLQDRDEDLAN